MSAERFSLVQKKIFDDQYIGPGWLGLGGYGRTRIVEHVWKLIADPELAPEEKNRLLVEVNDYCAKNGYQADFILEVGIEARH